MITKNWGKLKKVYVFSPEFIAIDFEDVSFTYRKGQNHYQTIRIAPVTGMSISSTCTISNRAEFLDNLLEILAEANIRRQLEVAPLGTIVEIKVGAQSYKVDMGKREYVGWFAKHLVGFFKYKDY